MPGSVYISNILLSFENRNKKVNLFFFAFFQCGENFLSVIHLDAWMKISVVAVSKDTSSVDTTSEKELLVNTLK